MAIYTGRQSLGSKSGTGPGPKPQGPPSPRQHDYGSDPGLVFVSQPGEMCRPHPWSPQTSSFSVLRRQARDQTQEGGPVFPCSGPPSSSAVGSGVTGWDLQGGLEVVGKLGGQRLWLPRRQRETQAPPSRAPSLDGGHFETGSRTSRAAWPWTGPLPHGAGSGLESGLSGVGGAGEFR